MTPAFARIGPYRFFFYAKDRGEARHVHVHSRGRSAKFWLDPVRLAHNRRFPERELSRIEALVTAHAIALRRNWDEYFA